MAIQTLTAQYPTLYTRKFRVQYTHYNGAAGTYRSNKLFDLNRNWDVAYVKLWTDVRWAGASINNMPFRIHDTNSLPGADSAAGQYASVLGNVPQGASLGTFNFTQPRPNAAPTTNNGYIGDQSATYGIYLTASVGPLGNFVNLTAGSLYIWVGVFRNP